MRTGSKGPSPLPRQQHISEANVCKIDRNAEIKNPKPSTVMVSDTHTHTHTSTHLVCMAPRQPGEEIREEESRCLVFVKNTLKYEM